MFYKPCALLTMLLSLALGCSALERATATQVDQVMLILRGLPNSESPQGQLDDRAALEYAGRVGFRGEILDVAGNAGTDTAQFRMALERIRSDQRITALYGFSAGGYNARLIWNELSTAERHRMRKVVVIGSPGVSEADFAGSLDVVIKPDPPEGHLAGPKALLESVDLELSGVRPVR